MKIRKSIVLLAGLLVGVFILISKYSDYEACFITGNSSNCLVTSARLTIATNKSYDIQRSLDFAKKGCELENIASCAQMSGLLLFFGKYQEALLLAKNACARGNKLACCNLNFIGKKIQLSIPANTCNHSMPCVYSEETPCFGTTKMCRRVKRKLMGKVFNFNGKIVNYPFNDTCKEITLQL
jgi:hypothetical protein